MTRDKRLALGTRVRVVGIINETWTVVKHGRDYTEVKHVDGGTLKVQRSGLIPVERSEYVNVAYTINSDVMHHATTHGHFTMCGIRIPSYDPADKTRPYDPAWEVKKGRLSLVTCKKCNGERQS